MIEDGEKELLTDIRDLIGRVAVECELSAYTSAGSAEMQPSCKLYALWAGSLKQALAKIDAALSDGGG